STCCDSSPSGARPWSGARTRSPPGPTCYGTLPSPRTRPRRTASPRRRSSGTEARRLRRPSACRRTAPPCSSSPSRPSWHRARPRSCTAMTRSSAEAWSTAPSGTRPVRVLIRLVAITLAGAVLYYAGVVNAIVIYRPSGYGAVLVVLGIALSGAMLVVAMVGDGRGEAETAAQPRYVRMHRIAWLVVCVMALVGASWLIAAPRQQSGDWTP